MTLRSVYIVASGAALPGAPVGNEAAEAILGTHSRAGSRTRAIVQRNNGILTRHYALDPTTRLPTHTNAQLTVEAVRALSYFPDGTHVSEQALRAATLLCCGTSTPDQLIPAHGAMVHGEMRTGPMEVITAAGVCLSGVSALKTAWLSLATGESERAIVTGSELVSVHLRKERYLTAALPSGAPANNTIACEPAEVKAEELAAARVANDASVGFEKEFLRWMLSDGAGALLLDAAPAAERLSLRIDWIDMSSYAGNNATCMYMGALRDTDGSLTGWGTQPTQAEIAQSGALLCGQDAKLLARTIGPVCVEESLARVRAARRLDTTACTWFLPHYSSEYFREELHARMLSAGCPIPYERWFTNLRTKGNTGAASIFVMLDELCHSGRLNPGDTVLCFVPESARFSVGWIHLTAVGPHET